MKITLLVFLLSIQNVVHSQLSATFSTTINTNCNGDPCDYDGPTILINELMISPFVGDGSISGPSGGSGEWIELYNPDICESVDISCFHLGNYTSEGATAFRLPDNLIVPPGGFVMVRGINADPVPASLLIANGGNVIEIVVPSTIFEPAMCYDGIANRMWFPNFGGWFGFYDSNGVPQDAVSWGPGNALDQNGAPCSPVNATCSSIAALSSYTNIPVDRKFYANPDDASTHMGNSIRRIPDGGAWSGTGAPTFATCNQLPCAVVGGSDCTGSATVNVTGGTAPYTYLWDDAEAQTTQTALLLCEGTYQVTVTDFNGQTENFTVQIENFVPTVTLTTPDDLCENENSVTITNYTPVPVAGQSGVLSGSGVSGFDFDPTIAGLGTQTLTYTFTDEFGCTNFAEDQITVNPVPIVTLEMGGPYCENDAAFTVTNLSPPSASSASGSGILSGPGISSPTFSPAVAGDGLHSITYTYTNEFGCVNSISDNVQVIPLPIMNFSANPTSGFYPLTVEFTNNTTGANSFLLDFGDGTSSSNNFTTIENTYENPGTYVAILTASQDGCENSASITINADIDLTYEIPNVFTPNGDETNSVFTFINPNGFETIVEFKIDIVNRWGNLIRTFSSYDFEWDGKDKNGDEVSEGVYFYVVSMTDLLGENYEHHGFIHLVRN